MFQYFHLIKLLYETKIRVHNNLIARHFSLPFMGYISPVELGSTSTIWLYFSSSSPYFHIPIFLFGLRFQVIIFRTWQYPFKIVWIEYETNRIICIILVSKIYLILATVTNFPSFLINHLIDFRKLCILIPLYWTTFTLPS